MNFVIFNLIRLCESFFFLSIFIHIQLREWEWWLVALIRLCLEMVSIFSQESHSNTNTIGSAHYCRAKWVRISMQCRRHECVCVSDVTRSELLHQYFLQRKMDSIEEEKSNQLVCEGALNLEPRWPRKHATGKKSWYSEWSTSLTRARWFRSKQKFRREFIISGSLPFLPLQYSFELQIFRYSGKIKIRRKIKKRWKFPAVCVLHQRPINFLNFQPINQSDRQYRIFASSKMQRKWCIVPGNAVIRIVPGNRSIPRASREKKNKILTWSASMLLFINYDGDQT